MSIPGRSRLAGVVVGIGLAYSVLQTSYFNVAPIALALPMVLGVLIGQVLTPRPARLTGVASLRTRRIGDYFAARNLIAVSILPIPLAVFAVIGLPVEQPGRYSTYGHDVQLLNLYYILATELAVLVLAALAAWAVIRAPGSGDELAGESWRHETAVTIVSTCVTLFAALLSAIALIYASQQMDWRAAGNPLLGIGLSFLGAACLMTFAWHAYVLGGGVRTVRS